MVTALAPAIWGTTYLVTTELLPPDRPLLAAVVRALPAGLLLVALTRRLPRGVWWWRAAVLGALNIGAFFALLFVAAYRLPGGVAATIGAVQPLLVAGLSAGLLGERLSLRTTIAAAAGVAGVSLLVLRADARLDALGVAAAVGGAVVMAIGVVLSKRWPSPAPLLATTGWQLIAGGLLLLPVALLVEGPPPATLSIDEPGRLRLPRDHRLRAGLRPLVPGDPRPVRHRRHLPRPAQPPGRHLAGLARSRPGTHDRPGSGRSRRPRRPRRGTDRERSRRTAAPPPRRSRGHPGVISERGRAISFDQLIQKERRTMRITVFGAGGASAAGWWPRRCPAATRSPPSCVIRRASTARPPPTVRSRRRRNVEDVAELSVGQDLVISATRPAPGREGELVTTVRALLAGLARTGVRLLVVGGAGSLTVPGTGGTVIDDPDFPADWRDIALACNDQLEACRAETEWTGPI